MKFTTDHYFQIGYQHYISGKPCQDYAISKTDSANTYAIISDGCSTGGNTDVGARIISLASLIGMKNIFYIEDFHIYQQDLINNSKLDWDLHSNDLLATCLSIHLDKSGSLINIQGDGVVVIKFIDGNILLNKYEYSNNNPLYPSYSEKDIEQYKINFPNTKVIVNQVTYLAKENTFPSIITREDSVDNLQHIKIDSEMLKQIEYVAIFTDGICQIDQVDWKDAVIAFMNFKSTTGEFVKRRMIRQIKEYQKIGRGPLDDIAGAVIHIERD